MQTIPQEEEATRARVTGWNTFQKLNKGKPNIAGEWRLLPSEEKRKYGNKQPKVKVLVRCRVDYFVDTLESIGHERRKWLQDTPFHKLLEMERDILDNDLIQRLVTLFNTQDQTIEFEGETRVITAKDFTQIMGIKDGDDEVILPRRGQKGQNKPRKGQSKNLPTLSDLKRDFVKEGQVEICMDKVFRELTQGSNEDNVKRTYVLFALRYIICANDLRLSYLELVRDVGELRNKKWATFAIQRLVKDMKSYKKTKAKAEIIICGCTIFLQLFATKGSITVPKGNPPCESRSCGKRKHPGKRDDKMSKEEILELYHEAHKSYMAVFEEQRKKLFKKYKETPSKQKALELWSSVQKKNFEKTSTMIDGCAEGAAKRDEKAAKEDKH